MYLLSIQNIPTGTEAETEARCPSHAKRMQHGVDDRDDEQAPELQFGAGDSRQWDWVETTQGAITNATRLNLTARTRRECRAEEVSPPSRARTASLHDPFQNARSQPRVHQHQIKPKTPRVKPAMKEWSHCCPARGGQKTKGDGRQGTTSGVEQGLGPGAGRRAGLGACSAEGRGGGFVVAELRWQLVKGTGSASESESEREGTPVE
ncbi:hypothetical protein DFH07DRAFT_763677 [Mycena maculata]|uniref:Uncharacterized protein n=1 Tax=Mycena maculata TaxID=230809 RepID=A0AAD7KHZ1_9AGAR|nr:hypothetical protein DFH07DRAFT_763677 [Mycena maculata]